MPIGKHDRDNVPFSQGEANLELNDMVYLHTDGYADQFGGSQGKKFKSANLRNLLSRIGHLTCEEQYKIIKSEFEKWIGNSEQIDDVCIIGLRILPQNNE